MKKVTVVVELDESFVGLLQASVQLKGWLGEHSEPLDPCGVLAVAVLGEARGASKLQVHLAIPPGFRPHFEVLHDERRVTEIKLGGEGGEADRSKGP